MEETCEICGKKEVYSINWGNKQFCVCGGRCEEVLIQRETDKKSPFIREDNEITIPIDEAEKLEKARANFQRSKEQLLNSCKYKDYESSVWASDALKKTLLKLADKHKKVQSVREMLEKEYVPILKFNNELREKAGIVREMKTACREKVDSLKEEIQMIEMKTEGEISKIVKASYEKHLSEVGLITKEPKI